MAGLSYAGQFNISVIADRDSWPDLEMFVEASKTELNWLTQRSSTPHGAGD